MRFHVSLWEGTCSEHSVPKPSLPHSFFRACPKADALCLASLESRTYPEISPGVVKEAIPCLASIGLFLGEGVALLVPLQALGPVLRAEGVVRVLSQIRSLSWGKRAPNFGDPLQRKEQKGTVLSQCQFRIHLKRTNRGSSSFAGSIHFSESEGGCSLAWRMPFSWAVQNGGLANPNC